jgi:hypothetical protein
MVCVAGTCQLSGCFNNSAVCTSNDQCCSEQCSPDSRTCIEPATGPACPSEQVKVKEQGSYDIYVRAGYQGDPELKVVYVRDSPNGREKEAACYINGGRIESDVGKITFPTDWISYVNNTVKLVYARQKAGDCDCDWWDPTCMLDPFDVLPDWDPHARDNCDHNDLKIVARMQDDAWMITGDADALILPQTRVQNGGAGHTCWNCGANGDVECDQMRVLVPTDLVPQCDPRNQTNLPGGNGTGTDGCSKISESCTDETDCCLYNSDELESGAYCDSRNKCHFIPRIERPLRPEDYQ